MLAAQSCPTLYDPMDDGPQGSSVHGILQARILEWVSRPRDQTQVSQILLLESVGGKVGEGMLEGYHREIKKYHSIPKKVKEESSSPPTFPITLS